MKSGKVFLGILAGASAGALLGILFAPRNGQDTRKEIAKTSKKYANDIKGEFNDTLHDLTQKFNKVKDDVFDFVYQAKEKQEELKNENGL